MDTEVANDTKIVIRPIPVDLSVARLLICCQSIYLLSSTLLDNPN